MDSCRRPPTLTKDKSSRRRLPKLQDGWNVALRPDWTVKVIRHALRAAFVFGATALALFIVWLRTDAAWAATLSGVALAAGVAFLIRAFLWRVADRRPK